MIWGSKRENGELETGQQDARHRFFSQIGDKAITKKSRLYSFTVSKSSTKSRQPLKDVHSKVSTVLAISSLRTFRIGGDPKINKRGPRVSVGVTSGEWMCHSDRHTCAAI